MTTDLSILAEEHYAGLTSYVRAKVRSASLAADIVQESWLRALIAIRKGNVRDGRGYLYRTARNLLIDLHRQERARSAWVTQGDLPDNVACDRPDAERIVMARQELDRVMRAVVELPPRCQAVFVMRKFDGLSAVEIAARLGIRRGTVEKHLRVALAHLLCRLGTA